MYRVMVFSLAACVLATMIAGVPASGAGAPPSISLRDPDGHSVNPFLAAESSTAVVFLFTSVDCPVSNRYAPMVQRLHAEYAPKNVAFWLVYPNPTDTPDAVHKHLHEYGYPVHALLDPHHELVKLAGAVVTPEAAVFDKARALAYHGRIDDKYVSLGVERPAAARHDLADALAAVVAGRTPAESTAPAVGCFIADFVQ
jgi:hypothetical protein